MRVVWCVLFVAVASTAVSGAVTDVEKDVLKWLNIARTKPEQIIKELEAILPNFDPKSPMLYRIPGDPVAVLTNEGPTAVKEAIADYKKKIEQRKFPLPELEFTKGLTLSAQDHANDQGNNGVFSHAGTDGSTPWARMARYGKWKTTAAENMGTGYNTGLDIVRALLIDDGEPDRGHRKNILNPTLSRCGVAVRPHSAFGFINVQDFTGVWTGMCIKGRGREGGRGLDCDHTILTDVLTRGSCSAL